jgi:hypothetical protein
MTSSEDELTPWWGDFEIEVDRGGRWEVGPSTLWLYRTEREWRVIYRPGLSTGEPDPLAHNSQATVPAPADEFDEVFAGDDEDLQISRHGFSKTRGPSGWSRRWPTGRSSLGRRIPCTCPPARR